MEFDVAVWGWFPGNDYASGGSPDLDDTITVTAISEEKGIALACAQFDAEHGFDVVCGEIA